MESIINELSEIFRNKDIILTSQRKEIIKAFLQCENHMRPEDIYELVKNKGVGVATVYRTIHLLVGLGIVSEFMIDRDKIYELKKYSGKGIHINFKCTSCGKIYDFFDDELISNINQLKNDVNNQFKAEINDIILVMNGKCDKCRGY